MTIHYRDVGSVLQFTQTVKTNILPASASNTLVFTQHVRTSPNYQKAKQKLNFVQQSVGHKGVNHQSVSQHITFSQEGLKVWQLSVNQLLFFVGHAQLNAPTPNSILAFSQVATVVVVKAGASQLIFTQQAKCGGNWKRGASNTVTFSGLAVAYIQSPSFIGVPIVYPTPPSVGDGRCD